MNSWDLRLVLSFFLDGHLQRESQGIMITRILTIIRWSCHIRISDWAHMDNETMKNNTFIR